jgi:hypothetical protein
MKSVFCKANNKEIKEREEKREREIIEKVRRQKPWPEPPAEKKPEPKKDKKESS